MNDNIYFNDKENQELIKLFELKKFSDAKKKAKEILLNHPNAYVVHNIFGAILSAENDFDKAIEHYKKAIKIKSDYAEAYNNLGTTMQKIHNLNEAILNYKFALKNKPKFAEAYNNLGTALHKVGSFNDAIFNFNQAIKIKKNYEEAITNLGNSLFEQGNFQEAIIKYKSAISINSNYAKAYSFLGNSFTKLGKYDEAIANHRKAIEIDPKSEEVYCNLGNTFAEMKIFKEAINNYHKAILINPNYNEALFNESLAKLTLGEFEEGWKKYEFRFDRKSNYHQDINVINSMRYPDSKVWKGEYLDGTLLIWAEQGIGDHILFSSMLTDLSKSAKYIIIEIDNRLVNLLKRYFDKLNFSNIKIKSTDKKLPDGFDKHIAIGSLGQYLRKSKESFKNTPKKFLVTSNSIENKLKKNFFKSKKFKVGISWKTLNKKQQNRNIDLIQMTSILSNPNCEFFNLQFGNSYNDIKEIFSKKKIKIQTISEVDNFNDIDSFAALINCLDLIITIQNSTAHLSCALGKKTWIMLANNARWHWLLNEKKSLWYPTATLFRQEKIGDWNTVINSIGMELKKLEIFKK